jgi:hypothetical protein
MLFLLYFSRNPPAFLFFNVNYRKGIILLPAINFNLAFFTFYPLQ